MLWHRRATVSARLHVLLTYVQLAAARVLQRRCGSGYSCQSSLSSCKNRVSGLPGEHQRSARCIKQRISADVTYMAYCRLKGASKHGVKHIKMSMELTTLYHLPNTAHHANRKLPLQTPQIHVYRRGAERIPIPISIRSDLELTSCPR